MIIKEFNNIGSLKDFEDDLKPLLDKHGVRIQSMELD